MSRSHTYTRARREKPNLCAICVRRSSSRSGLGLALDISQVLVAHGYPPIATAADLLRWQSALFTTIYHTRDDHTGKETP